MIPRLKPALGAAELAAISRPGGATVEAFEQTFARAFGASHAVAFPYGRSALWAWFKALGIEGRDVIVPAYTCVVVPHAIVLSGNTCRFVDAAAPDWNMNLDELSRAISPRTQVVVATHLFGMPADCDRLHEIVRDGEARVGHRILVVHDCAHAFGARWRGRLVANEGDAALFGLGVSKLITSVFGGMLTIEDDDMAARVRAWRDRQFHPAGFARSIAKRLYLAGVYAAFQNLSYGIVRWLQDETPLLDPLTKAYHLDDRIRFPPDHLDRMSSVEARVGLLQLAKYDEIVRRRRETAAYYDAHLPRVPGWTLPPIVDGATYSHYVIRTRSREERDRIKQEMLADGIQVGELIEYSVPHMRAYGPAPDDQWPESRRLSECMINLPVHASLTAAERAHVVDAMQRIARDAPAASSWSTAGAASRSRA